MLIPPCQEAELRYYGDTKIGRIMGFSGKEKER